LPIKLDNSLEYLGGIGAYLPALILAYNPFILSELKGGLNVHNSYRTTPKDHISHLLS